MWQQKGFVQGDVDIAEAMQRLSMHIDQVPVQFKTFSEQELTSRRAEGKWSRKEILGHLVDSAINNLKRFTEIQFLPQPFYINSYNQVELVKVNHYQDLPLDHLLNLWQALNRQIVLVVEKIPSEKLNYPVDPQYDNKEMKTLGWIIADYVAHMEHHLKQLSLPLSS